MLLPIFAPVGAGRRSEHPLAQLSGPSEQPRVGRHFALLLETGNCPASPII
jgi:hypothetical protein